MKNKTNVGNVIIVLDKPLGRDDVRILLGRKGPRKKSDDKRKRKRVGIGCWVPPGGGTESDDKSQKHSARRELLEETGFLFPLKSFKKVGVMRVFLSDILIWVVHIYLVDTTDPNLDYAIGEDDGEYLDMRWFSLEKLPFAKMLEGDGDWLPRIMKGEKLSIIKRIKKSPNGSTKCSVEMKPVNFN
ncbi:MAG: NUDIX domain-containing protein [Candidatus Paceibacterota bacterium]